MSGYAFAGMSMFKSSWLRESLSRTGNGDVLSHGVRGCVSSVIPRDASCYTYIEQSVCLKIVTRVDLAAASSSMRIRINRLLMKAGMLLEDPDHTYIDSHVSIGAETVIRPGCVIEGDSSIGVGCIIGPHAIIWDSRLGDQCLIETAVIGESSLDPGNRVGVGVHLTPNIQINTGAGA